MGRKRILLLPAVLLVLAGALPGRDGPAPGPSLKETKAVIEKRVAEEYPSLEGLYKHLHANPELALQEEQTAARLAKELRAAGFEVTEKVGGHGVVGVLNNGTGPTVLVRADMDALPIEEKTGLAYASKVHVRDRDGNLVGVMHACGHDVNVTSLVGTARVLAGLKDRWQGTLVFIGQPAEETGAGARLMLTEGKLFERFGKPDYCLALHCDARYPHGHVNYRAGQMQANVDSVDVVVRGKGGDASAPDATVDPVVLAARIVVDLQAIVSREKDPLDGEVVTVGSIHGGGVPGGTPDEVRLQLTVRTTGDASRKRVLESIERRVKAAARGAGASEPVVKIDVDGFTPALVNDPELTRKMVALFQEVLGDERVHERPMSLGGEDFSRYVREGVPGFYFFVGSAPPELVARANEGGPPLALTHSDGYYPVPEPTIKTGVLTMSLAVLRLAGK
jgi:hippurate hydrolase